MTPTRCKLFLHEQTSLHFFSLYLLINTTPFPNHSVMNRTTRPYVRTLHPTDTRKHSEKLSLSYTNYRSINKKFIELQHVISLSHHDLICLSETRFVDSSQVTWTQVNFSHVVDLTRLDSTRLDSTRLDSTRLDSTRLDSTRLDSTRLDSTRLDSTRLDSTRLDSTRLDSTRLDSTRLDSTRLDSTRLDSTRLDSTRLDSTRLDLT